MKDKPKYYYHVSGTPLKIVKNEITLKPRIDGDNRGSGEPKVSRTCVGPTIPHCLIALGRLLSRREHIYVYRTKNKVLGVGVTSKQVNDADVTKERWLIRPVKFVLDRTIEVNNRLMETLSNLSGVGSLSAIPDQKKTLKKLRKWKLFNK